MQDAVPQVLRACSSGHVPRAIFLRPHAANAPVHRTECSRLRMPLVAPSWLEPIAVLPSFCACAPSCCSCCMMEVFGLDAPSPLDDHSGDRRWPLCHVWNGSAGGNYNVCNDLFHAYRVTLALASGVGACVAALVYRASRAPRSQEA